MQDYVTKEGLENLKRELEELKGRRPELAAKLKRAISSGDLSENADYQEAKEEQAFLEGRISELEQMTASAIIIKEQRGATVKIGSTVRVIRKEGKEGRDALFTIVGSEETAPERGKISYLSPLGAALLGKRAGETVEISTPKGSARWEIRGVQ